MRHGGGELTAVSSYTVAFVEDESVLRQEMAFQLTQMGFAVESFDSASNFYRYLAIHPRTIAVLDIGLPGEDGLSICKYLREHDTQMGIVFLTARGLRSERLLGISSGADAYLVKPVDMDELALVLKRLLNRMDGKTPTSTSAGAEEKTTAQNWSLDMRTGYLLAPNQVQMRLSQGERLVLHTLLTKAGQVCWDVELHLAMGGHPNMTDRHRLEVLISRMRVKVERECGVKLPIKAVRGQGYLLEK